MMLSDEQFLQLRGSFYHIYRPVGQLRRLFHSRGWLGETVPHMSHCGAYTKSSGYPWYVVLMMKAEVKEPNPTGQAKPLLTSQPPQLKQVIDQVKSQKVEKYSSHSMSGSKEVKVYYHHGAMRNCDQPVTRPCLG